MAFPSTTLIDKLISANMLRKSVPIRCLLHKREHQDWYCRFCEDYSHNTDGCIPLKHEIYDLVQKGSMSNYCKNFASMSNLMVIRENIVNFVYRKISVVFRSLWFRESIIKVKFLNEVNKRCRYNYLNGIFTKTWKEFPSHYLNNIWMRCTPPL